MVPFDGVCRCVLVVSSIPFVVSAIFFLVSSIPTSIFWVSSMVPFDGVCRCVLVVSSIPFSGFIYTIFWFPLYHIPGGFQLGIDASVPSEVRLDGHA